MINLGGQVTSPFSWKRETLPLRHLYRTTPTEADTLEVGAEEVTHRAFQP